MSQTFVYKPSPKLTAARTHLYQLKQAMQTTGDAARIAQARAAEARAAVVMAEARLAIGEANNDDVARARQHAVAAVAAADALTNDAASNAPAVTYLQEQVEQLQAEEEAENFQLYRPLLSAAAIEYARAIDKLIVAGEELAKVINLAPALGGRFAPVRQMQTECELSNPGKLWKRNASELL